MRALYRLATATACSTVCVDTSEKSMGHKMCLIFTQSSRRSQPSRPTEDSSWPRSRLVRLVDVATQERVNAFVGLAHLRILPFDQLTGVRRQHPCQGLLVCGEGCVFTTLGL